MTVSLVELIEGNREWLVDEITKGAIRQIPSYGRAPIRQTMARIDRLLEILAESVRRNDPKILGQFLEVIAEERHERAYPIGALHALLDIAEGHLHELVAHLVEGEVEQNAQNALVNAIIDSAHMVFGKTYLLLAEGKA